MKLQCKFFIVELKAAMKLRKTCLSKDINVVNLIHYETLPFVHCGLYFVKRR